MRICKIETSYLDYLRQYDSKVSLDTTGTRKFIGIVLEIDNKKYYAPLSSPKQKHLLIDDRKKLDIHKIGNGVFGVINLNNMIPVHNDAIIDIDINKVPDDKYRLLLNNQIIHLKKETSKILRKARALHSVISDGRNSYLANRCCDFIFLQSKVDGYIKN